jgi:hypothetical protein
MPSLEKIYGGLQTIILERLASASGSPHGDPFVAFEYGLPIPDATFHLSDVDHTLSPQLAVEFLASHSNTIPEVRNNLFMRTLRTVEGQYEILLRGSKPSQAESQDLLELIKSSAVNTFAEPVASLFSAALYRPIVATPVNWYDSADSSNWTHVKFDQHDTPPPPPPPPAHGSTGSGGRAIPSGEFLQDFNPKLYEWRVAPEAFKPVLSETVSPNLLRNFTAAPQRIDPINLTMARTEIVGSSFAAGRQSAVAHPAFRATRLSTVRAGGFERVRPIDMSTIALEDAVQPITRFDAPIFANAIDLNAVIAVDSTPQPVQADGFSLELDICLVQISRPWLSDAFLTLPNWFMPGFDIGSYSKGTGESIGNFSLLPTACVLIRDLRIRADWSDNDQTVIEQSPNLGNFSLLGRSFDKNNMTLTVPGIQSFAWICEPMPLLPPSGPPTQ